MISDTQAVQFSKNAVQSVLKEESPNRGETVALFACALHESKFSYGWTGAGVGSFNEGAIQCGGWKGKRFVYVDTHPNPDGTSTKYSACFRAYVTEQDGWNDLSRVMYAGRRDVVRLAASRENWLAVSETMRSTGYYEGFGKTLADRVANHARAMAKGINRALKVYGDVPIVIPPWAMTDLERTLVFGCVGEDIKVLQAELQLARDGIFGKVTLAAVNQYQEHRGLKVDGIVGPRTWKELMNDEYIPNAA
jgi:hypothetical protein